MECIVSVHRTAPKHNHADKYTWRVSHRVFVRPPFYANEYYKPNEKRTLKMTRSQILPSSTYNFETTAWLSRCLHVICKRGAVLKITETPNHSS